MIKIANSEKSYKFDQIFTPSDKQPVIFENVCEELLDSALRGFNVCIFAYGFTGTGKTFTMFGDRAELVGEESNLGMIQRMCKELFESVIDLIQNYCSISHVFFYSFSNLDDWSGFFVCSLLAMVLIQNNMSG